MGVTARVLGVACVAQGVPALSHSPAGCGGASPALAWRGSRLGTLQIRARALGDGQESSSSPTAAHFRGSGVGWGARPGCQAGREGARSAQPPALCSCRSSLAGAASEQTAKARAYGNAYLTGIYIQQCLSAALFSFPNALIPPGSQLGRPGKAGALGRVGRGCDGLALPAGSCSVHPLLGQLSCLEAKGQRCQRSAGSSKCAPKGEGALQRADFWGKTLGVCRKGAGEGCAWACREPQGRAGCPAPAWLPGGSHLPQPWLSILLCQDSAPCLAQPLARGGLGTSTKG